MVDYSSQDRFKVENVDHDLELLGVKLGHWAYIAYMFFIGLFLAGIPGALTCAFSSFCLYRWIYKMEAIGEPVFFSKTFLRILRILPRQLTSRLFPVAKFIAFPHERYRT